MASNERSRFLGSTQSTTSDDEQDYDQLDDLDEHERPAHDVSDSASIGSLTVSSLQSLSPPGSDEVMVEHDYSEDSEFESGQEMMSGDETGEDEEDDHPMDETLYARLPSLSGSVEAAAMNGRSGSIANPLLPFLDLEAFDPPVESVNTLGLVFPEPAILSELPFETFLPPSVSSSEVSADADNEGATMTTSIASVTPSMFSEAHHLSDLRSLPPPSPDALHILLVGHKASNQLKQEILDAVFNLWPDAVHPREADSGVGDQSNLIQFFDFRSPEPAEDSRSISSVRVYDLSLRHAVQSYYTVAGSMVNPPVPVLTIFFIDPALCKGRVPGFFPSPMIGKAVAVVLPRGGHSAGSTPSSPNVEEQSVLAKDAEYVEISNDVDPADLMSAQHIWSNLRAARTSYLFEGLDIRQANDFDRQVVSIGELCAGSERADVRLAASSFISPRSVEDVEGVTLQRPLIDLQDSIELTESSASIQTALVASVSTVQGQEKVEVSQDDVVTSSTPISKMVPLDHSTPFIGMLCQFATRCARYIPHWTVMKSLSLAETWSGHSAGMISLGAVVVLALAFATVTFQNESDLPASARDLYCTYPSWAQVFCSKPIRTPERMEGSTPTATSLMSAIETAVDTAVYTHKVQATETSPSPRLLTLEGRKNSLSVSAPPTPLGIGGRMVSRTDSERMDVTSLSLLPVTLNPDGRSDKCLTCFQLFGPPTDVDDVIVMGGTKSPACTDAASSVQRQDAAINREIPISVADTFQSDDERHSPVTSLSVVQDVSLSLVTAVKNHHKRAAHNVHVLNTLGCEMTKIAAHKLASVFQRGVSGLEPEDPETSWYDELLQPLRRALADRRDMKTQIMVEEESTLSKRRSTKDVAKELLRGVFAAAV